MKDELKLVLESQDREIFTDELIGSLMDIFSKKEDDIKLVLESQSKQEIKEFSDKYELEQEEFKTQLKKDYDEKYEKLVKSTSDYVDYELNKIHSGLKNIYQNEAIVDDAIQIHKRYLSSLKKYSIEYENINESDKTRELKSEIDALTDRLNQAEDNLVTESQKRMEIIEIGVISELSEGMTALQREKFKDYCSDEHIVNESQAGDFIQSIVDKKDEFIRTLNKHTDEYTDDGDEPSGIVVESQEEPQPVFDKKKEMIKRLSKF